MKWIILLALVGNTPGGIPSFETDSFPTENGKPLKITFIKHASLILNFNERIIYVDPVSDYADYTDFSKADVILVTHEHQDHLDPKAIADISRGNTLLITNPASQAKLGKGQILRNGEHLQPFPGFTLEAVPAYNTTPDREKYHPKNRDNGYILTLGKKRIYIAGDTEDIPEMQQIKDIDIAFLPVNQPYTMTVPQAAHAARMIKPKILYPYHYGNTEIASLKETLKTNPEIEVRIRQLQ